MLWKSFCWARDVYIYIEGGTGNSAEIVDCGSTATPAGDCRKV